MNKVLDTGVNNVRNVSRYIFGQNCLAKLAEILSTHCTGPTGHTVYFVDSYFRENGSLIDRLPIEESDQVVFVSTVDEPTTDLIDTMCAQILSERSTMPRAIVGVGGGITLDTAKAISNLIGNGGRAEDYQGWDLLSKPGVYKVGIPTISGTGAEATRTCVMTNPRTGAKLGMNSDFTVFDQLLLDPDLSATVPRDQYFYTGMDAYIHCFEALRGSHRNVIGDAMSIQALDLCRQVFKSDQMMSDVNRANLMVASYLGGCAIATSYVGVVHPFSAGLSVVLGLHHGIANCIALMALSEFYKEERDQFIAFADKQEIDVPKDVCSNLSEDAFESLYKATIVHEKPLTNALGADFQNILTREKVKQIFAQM